jgi:hypothetical protein
MTYKRSAARPGDSLHLSPSVASIVDVEERSRWIGHETGLRVIIMFKAPIEEKC